MSPTSPAIEHEKMQPALIEHLGRTHQLLAEASLPTILSNLIELRVSQINGCGYCVELHTKRARANGETNERLDRIAAWHHSSSFSDAEKAAFRYAEALTYLDRGCDLGSLRAEMLHHYSAEQVTLITICVAMINLWNRIQISNH